MYPWFEREEASRNTMRVSTHARDAAMHVLSTPWKRVLKSIPLK